MLFFAESPLWKKTKTSVQMKAYKKDTEDPLVCKTCHCISLLSE